MTSKISKRSIILLAILIYLLTLAIRVYHISEQLPRPDEPLWQERSHAVLQQYRAGHYTELTTHLAHPGIPAAYTMAIGQGVGEWLNEVRGVEFGDPNFTDRLTASRIGIAIVASLISSLLIIAFSQCFGLKTVFLAAILLTLDPLHIDLSRIAHVDAIDTVLIALCSVLFIQLMQQGRTWQILLAGLTWGLAFSTKPTALFLVPPILIVSFISKMARKKPFITCLPWKELCAFSVGLTTFALLYSRLSHKASEFNHVVNIGLGNQIWAHSFTSYVGSHKSLSLGISGALVFLGLYCFVYTKTKSPNSNSLKIQCGIATFMSLLLVAVLFFPLTFENLIGYIAWTLGLRNEVHYAQGTVWSPAEYGYIELLYRRLPTIVSFGLLLSTVVAIHRIIKRHKNFDLLVSIPMLFLVLAVFFWLLGLSVSAKQTYRYAMPIVPFIYLISAWGFTQLLSKISSMEVGLSFARVKWLGPLAYSLLPFTQCFATYELAPDYSLFYNELSGGIQSAVKHGLPISIVRQENAIEFLHDLAQRDGEPIYASTFNNAELLNFAYHRMYPAEYKSGKQLLHFLQPWPNAHGRYILAYNSFKQYAVDHEKLKANYKKIYSFETKGLPIYEIYSPLQPLLGESLKYEIFEMARETGQKESYVLADGSKIETLAARLGRDNPGFLTHGDTFRLAAGRYIGKFNLSLLLLDEARAKSTDAPIARVELGSMCQKIVYPYELKRNSFSEILLPCANDHIYQGPVRVYWYGNYSLRLRNIELALD